MKAPKSFNIHMSYAAHSSVATHIIIPQYTQQLCCTQFSSYPHHHPINTLPNFPTVRQLTLTFYGGFHKQFTDFYHSVNLMKIICLYILRRVRVAAKSAFYLRHACLSVRIYQLGSHWTDFRENWYWILLWNSVEKCKIWTKPRKIYRAPYLNVILRYLLFLSLQTSLTMARWGWNTSEVNSQNCCI
jgi:hypothetical protein